MTKNLARRTFDAEVVLDAAAHVFRKRGFGGATVREVAAQAGMLPGSLHYRFPSKEALLVGLMERAISKVTAAVRRATEGAKDPSERLRLGMRAHLDALMSGDDDLYVLLYDWKSLPGSAMPALQRARARYEIFWDDLLTHFARSGWARPGLDVELVRQFGFGALNWVAQWREPNDPRSTEEIADALWECLALGWLTDDKRRALSKSRKTK